MSFALDSDRPVRIAIVTDAWAPQVNGVVRTLEAVTRELEAAGHQILIISPDHYRSLPCPTYPEIRLALATPRGVGARLAAFVPDAIHLSTEGPLCVAARRWCMARKLHFTTAYHTHFPDYVARRTGLSAEWVWPAIRWFHGPSSRIMVSTEAVRAQLRAQRLTRLGHWGRGVDLDLFGPDAPLPPEYAGLPRPLLLYVGRVAVEKNIEAFLECRHPGTKLVVGDGPERERLAARYPDAHFLGARSGQALAGCYAHADVFVFPSRTDTFGLVMIEALASGTPVAAYPVTGPIDVVTPETGALDEDLDIAIAAALTRDRGHCLGYGRSFTWRASAEQFMAALVDAHGRDGDSGAEPVVMAQPVIA